MSPSNVCRDLRLHKVVVLVINIFTTVNLLWFTTVKRSVFALYLLHFTIVYTMVYYSQYVLLWFTTVNTIFYYGEYHNLLWFTIVNTTFYYGLL